MTVTTPRRSCLRFSLRTMFVLLTVIGICLGWLGVQMNRIRERHEALDRIARSHNRYGLGKQCKAPWGLAMLGEKGVESILVFLFPNEEVERLGRLFPEARMTENGIVDFSEFKSPDPPLEFNDQTATSAH